jgi:hypothetical protein
VPLIGILRFSHKQGGEAIVARSQGVLESTYEVLNRNIIRIQRCPKFFS